MFSRNNYVACGTVVKTHGTSGHIKVDFSDHFNHNYHERDWLFIAIEQKPVPFFIERFIDTDDGLSEFQLEDISTPEEALSLVKHSVLYPIDQLGDWQKNPLVFSTLNGYEVYDQNGNYQGVIQGVEEQADQFLLTIEKADETTFMAPCQEDLVYTVDHQQRYLKILIPEGLDTLWENLTDWHSHAFRRNLINSALACPLEKEAYFDETGCEWLDWHALAHQVICPW